MAGRIPEQRGSDAETYSYLRFLKYPAYRITKKLPFGGEHFQNVERRRHNTATHGKPVLPRLLKN